MADTTNQTGPAQGMYWSESRGRFIHYRVPDDTVPPVIEWRNSHKPLPSDAVRLEEAQGQAAVQPEPTQQQDAFETPDAAREAGRAGWNIRCNRCGSYGARWRPDERPGWHFGNLALCDPHADELGAEYARHQAALAVLREVRYEQEAR